MPPTIIRRWPNPTKNGIQLQFSSIDLNLGGIWFPFVNEISYDQNLEPGEARGTSPYPMGVTLGEYKVTGSLTIQRIHRDLLLRKIERGQAGFMDKFFHVTVVYQENGWSSVETDEFDARITGTGHEYSAGNNVLMVKLPLYIPFVIVNGHVPTAGLAL